jgi:hypothetical protein
MKKHSDYEWKKYKKAVKSHEKFKKERRRVKGNWQGFMEDLNKEVA